MKKEIKHYNIDNLVSQNADINILFGERSNGKSWQLKHKRAIINYLETGKRFILMRRFREEITNGNIEQYFQDVDVEGLTKGKYNCITTYRKHIYLSHFDSETFTTKRGEKIGYAVALSTEQNYAGGSFLDVSDIIFEEFMTRSRYLGENEPTKLMNFYATIDRKRGTTKLWLVGNSISRVCPYLYQWGLDKIVAKQKQGTIETLDIDAGEGDTVKLAIEYCASTGVSSHTIGWNKDMMNDGSWQSNPQPHLPKSKNDYNVCYRIGFMYQNFKFIGELLQDKETKDICWFIYPCEKDFRDDLVIFSDVIKPSIYYQRNIYDITIKNDNLQKLLNTFREDKIFYCNDLVGTDFKQVIDFSIRR